METTKTIQVSKPSDREIRTERILNAPRELVWRAYTDPNLLAKWWARGNKMDMERFELRPGGHWRFVERAPEGNEGFEGRFREISPPERLSQTFEWDGMPGHVSVDTATFEDLGDGRTKVTTVTQFMTTEERDGMFNSGMTEGMEQGYAALDRLLASMK